MNRIKRLFSHEEDQEEKKYPEKSYKQSEVTANPKTAFEQIVLRFIPLREGDCLSCKLISSSIVLASSVYVMITCVRQRGKEPTRFRQAALYITCTGVSAGLATVAMMRLFDVGLFEKKNEK